MSRKKNTAASKNAKADKKSNTAAACSKVPTPTRNDSVLEQPVPRKLSTSPAANDSALTTPPPKHYAPRDPSVASLSVPMVSVGATIKSEQTNPTEAVAPDKFGLSDKQHVINEKDLANVLSIVIADAFRYGRRKLFHQQFQDYLPKLGADNERSFSMLNAEKSWFHNSTHVAFSCVNVSVVRLLVQLANYTGTVLRRGKFVTPTVRYKFLKRFVLEGTNHPGRYDARGSDSSIAHVPQNYTNKKLPGFKVPKFDGDTLTGDVFLKKI